MPLDIVQIEKNTFLVGVIGFGASDSEPENSLTIIPKRIIELITKTKRKMLNKVVINLRNF